MKKLVVLLVLMLFLVCIPSVLANTFIDDDDFDFNSGNHYNTEWNDNSYVTLTGTNTSGTFESRIFEESEELVWRIFEWGESLFYSDRLPDNQARSDGANMTGNRALYHMDETTGTEATDYSGRGYDAQILLSPDLGQPGRFDYSFYFDETEDRLSIPHAVMHGLGNFTFEAWFKTTKTGQQALISGANSLESNEFLLFFNTNTVASLHLKGTSYNFNVPIISDNEWHHVAWTRNIESLKQFFYFDGVKKGSNTVTTALLNIDANGLVLGEEQDMVGGEFLPAQAFDGYIDEVAIYDRELKESEILKHYKRGIIDLKFQMRSDDDNSDWGEFVGPDATQYTYFIANNNTNLPVDNSKYFQYKAYFSTEKSAHKPQLENVSIHYEISNQKPTKPVLTSPENNSIDDELGIVNLQYSSTDPENQDLSYYVYLFTTSGFHMNDSTLIYNGSDSYTTYDVVEYGKYFWRVIANDGVLNSDPSDEGMFDIREDINPPVISDENISSSITEGQIVTVTANITDNSSITAWLNVKNSYMMVYSMSEQDGLWRAIFIAGDAGAYQFRVNATDNFENINNERDWIQFTISESSVCDRDDICETGETYENCAEDCCQYNETKSCGSNIGACLEGNRTCQIDGNWGNCVNETAPIDEICNDIDDDCDGDIDEDLECDVCEENETDICGSNVGACEQGIMDCINGQWGECVGSINPIEEICEGQIDDDCDGEIDDGCECTNGQQDICGSNIGACEYGISTCTDGHWGNCQGNVIPIEEICNNNVDDDCDGIVDTDCNEGGQEGGVPPGSEFNQSAGQGLFDIKLLEMPIGSWALIISGIVMSVIALILYFKSKKKSKLYSEKEKPKKKPKEKKGETPKEIPKEIPEEPEGSDDELIITGQLRHVMRIILHNIQKLQKINKR